MKFIENRSNGLVYMTSSNISAVHAFTTRYGGVSAGVYASLNLGENRGDDRLHVEENYRRICSSLDINVDDLVFSKQVHKADIRIVNSRDRHRLFSPVTYEADALITDKEAVPLVIFTADCVPILLHDPVCGVIGAAHAGWRGTALDIAGNTVGRMVCEFGCKAQNIQAAIGPSISGCCFETDKDVPTALFEVLGVSGGAYIDASEKEGKFKVDLKGCNKQLLMIAGVPEENISVSGECTCCFSDKYWSHRKMGEKRGSQASIIVMKGKRTE